MRNKRYQITWYDPAIYKHYVVETLPTTFEKAMCYAKHGSLPRRWGFKVVSVEPVKRRSRQATPSMEEGAEMTTQEIIEQVKIAVAELNQIVIKGEQK